MLLIITSTGDELFRGYRWCNSP